MAPDDQNRRQYPRLKLSVPIEFRPEGTEFPIRGATSDLSLSGCYTEMTFTFPVGTVLEISLQLEDPVIAVATVVTCDTQVGNGIKFTKMLPEDQDLLRAYLETAEKSLET
jgi:c-di-GMP-binding flagellar brake protein YcgR